MQKKYYNHIDLMKTIAMFFVVMTHMKISDVTGGFIDTLCRAATSACVPIFFFVNGFLLLNKEFDFKKHIVQILKFVALTYFWGIATLLVITAINGEAFSIRGMAVDLLFWAEGKIDHLWFMGSLVVIYLFFPLLKLAFDKQEKLAVFFTAAAAICTFGNRMLVLTIEPFAAEILSGLNGNLFTIFNPFAEIRGFSLVYFMLGGFMGRYHQRMIGFFDKKNININIAAPVIYLLSTFAWALYGMFRTRLAGSVYNIFWEGMDTVFVLIGVLAIYYMTSMYTGKLRIVKIISNNTLGIYFMHMIIIDCFKPYLIKIPFNQTLAGDFFGGIIMLFVSLGFVLLIKRIPLLKRIVY